MHQNILLYSCWTILCRPIGREKQNFTFFLLVVVKLFIKKTNMYILDVVILFFKSVPRARTTDGYFVHLSRSIHNMETDGNILSNSCIYNIICIGWITVIKILRFVAEYNILNCRHCVHGFSSYFSLNIMFTPCLL